MEKLAVLPRRGLSVLGLLGILFSIGVFMLSFRSNNSDDTARDHSVQGLGEYIQFLLAISLINIRFYSFFLIQSIFRLNFFS